MQILIIPELQCFVALQMNEIVLKLKFHRCSAQLYELTGFQENRQENPVMVEEMLKSVFTYCYKEGITVRANINFVHQYRIKREAFGTDLQQLLAG